MDSTLEFFRKVLKEFKTADALLSKQQKLSEERAEAQKIETTNIARAAENVATGCWQRIQDNNSSPADFGTITISSEIESELDILKSHLADIQKDKQELHQINNQLLNLRKELQESLLQEKQEQERLEQMRLEALQKEQSDRRKKIIRRFIIAGAATCVAIVLHFWFLGVTTLKYSFTLDGNYFPSGIGNNVTVDGKPFSDGDKISLGRHIIEIKLPKGETFSKKVWVFYGENDLGILRLESGKGSLSVIVKPAPATVVVKHEGKIISQGDAPLKVNKLLIGQYDIEIRRGEYEEGRRVTINRQQQTETVVELDLGSVQLLSDTPDADFQLLGNGRYWRGKLPTKIDDVPGGKYSLAVSRKGWNQNAEITINRGNVTTNKTEFSYGSIELTTDPTGLVVSTNGVEIGRSPMVLSELKPGQYSLTASDGENDLMTSVTIAPREAARHAFAFHYGTVQISSQPAGATVIRKGKEIGKTPLTLNHVPAGDTMVELRLQDYVSTNLPIHAVQDVATSLSAKLTSEHYLRAMQRARAAFENAEYSESKNYLKIALESVSNDPAAIKLQDEVFKTAAKFEEAKLQSEQARINYEQEIAVVRNQANQRRYKQLISSIPDARFYDDFKRVYSCDFNKLWEETINILGQQGEESVKADIETGIIKTDLTRHGIIGFPYLDRYLIFVERVDATTSKVYLKLILFWVDFEGEKGMQGELKAEKPENTKKRASNFFDKIDRAIKAR